MSKKKNFDFVYELVCYANTGSHRFLFSSVSKARQFVEDVPYHFDYTINKIKVL